MSGCCRLLVHGCTVVDRPMPVLGVLLIVLGCQCLGLGLLAELVARGRPACDAPRLIARVVTRKVTPAGEHGDAEAVAGRGP